MSDWVQTSALHAYRDGGTEAYLEGEDLRIRELPCSRKLLIQARGDTDIVCSTVSEIIGQELPLRPNIFTQGSGVNSGSILLWISPIKWLFISHLYNISNVSQEIKVGLFGIPNLLSDVSDARTGFEVSGARARSLLAKVCALDLDSASFGQGHCAQSMLVRIPLLLRHVNDLPTFHLYVDRSVARYAWDWLSDAAAEYLPGEPAR